jgi:DNA polymerase elongation subunit (family B)
MITIEIEGNKQKFQTREELDYYLVQNSLVLKSDGTIVRKLKQGIIPEVLTKWFADRVHYKNLMKKYVTEGNKELAEYYDRRQHIQKIFLNSMYGVLGLPSFRFYDVDNAQAVTISGQDVIKSSADFVNNLYISRNVPKKTKAWLDKYWAVLKEDAKSHKRPSPPYPSEDDHCVYIDTDSLYFSAETFLDKFNTDEEKQEFTIKLARAIESKLNKYYDEMAKDFFNCTNHQFFIKGESIAKTGIWTGKKRYALDKVYDLETNQPVSKTVFKGLDVVRSSFPKVFREFMKPLINDFLKGVSKEVIDQKILDFKASLQFTEEDISDVARNTSANGISQYDPGVNAVMNQFTKGTPINVKAAITYNRLLKHFKLDDKYEPIADGEKIKYVLLMENPLQIKAIAFKGYKDPKKVMDFIVKYVDTNALFESELQNKLEDFYNALNWGLLPTSVNQKASEFFSF